MNKNLIFDPTPPLLK